MTNRLQALVAVPDASVRNALANALETKGVEALFASTLGEARTILKREAVAVVFCQNRLEDGGFEDVLPENARLTPKIPIVVCSPSDDSGVYMDVMSRGAFDFIAFPYSRHEIEWVLSCALRGTAARAAGAA
ncbi:MAG: response regulator [Terriglobia bacterium]